MSRIILRPTAQCRNYEHYLQRYAVLESSRDDSKPLIPRTRPNRNHVPRQQKQPFSSSPWSPVGQRTSALKVKQKAQPSMQVQLQKQQQLAIEQNQQRDDLGLLPDTFIMPHTKTSPNLPPLLTAFRDRLFLERKRAWKRMADWPMLFYYHVWRVRPRPKFDGFAGIAGEGRRLHEGMYAAFARGNLGPVEESLASGLKQSLRTRIAQRAPGTFSVWTLHQHLSRPRLVSYRTGLMPSANGRLNKVKEAQNGIVQAVVRIHSLQSLQHFKTVWKRNPRTGKSAQEDVLVDAGGREVQPSKDGSLPEPDKKATVEYLVIQKNVRKSKESPWKVWGTTRETTLEDLEKQQAKKQGAGIIERLLSWRPQGRG